MADFSISDMPWLGQPADPAGSLARGIQAGSMIAQTRNQREALALRRMEFEEAQQERSAMMPLQLTLLQQEAQMKAIKIEDALTQRQSLIENEKLLSTLSSDIAFALSEQRPETAFFNLATATSVRPKIVEDPRFQELQKMIKTSVDASADLMRFNEQKRGHDLYERSLNLTERNVKLREEKVPLAEGDKMRLESLQKQLDQLNKNRLALPPEQQSQRFRVAMEAGIVQKQINEILAKYNQAPAGNEAPADVEPAQAPSPIDIGRFRVTPLP